MDAGDPGSYLSHDRGQNLVNDNWQGEDTILLRNRWGSIWDCTVYHSLQHCRRCVSDAVGGAPDIG